MTVSQFEGRARRDRPAPQDALRTGVGDDHRDVGPIDKHGGRGDYGRGHRDSSERQRAAPIYRLTPRSR